MSLKIVESPIIGIAGALAQPILMNAIGITVRNGAFWTTNVATGTLFADRHWMENAEVQLNVARQISNISESVTGIMPTYTAAVDTHLNVPLSGSYIPTCHNTLVAMTDVNTQDGANQLVDQFLKQCSSSEAFTGNRLELFVRNLGQVAQDTGNDLVNRVIETTSHPLASWFQSLGFATRTEDGSTQIAFSPDSVLPIVSLAVAFWGADYGLRKLSENKHNPVANLYNRSLSELNGAEKAARFTINGLIAAGTIGSLFGIIEAIN